MCRKLSVYGWAPLSILLGYPCITSNSWRHQEGSELQRLITQIQLDRESIKPENDKTSVFGETTKEIGTDRASNFGVENYYSFLGWKVNTLLFWNYIMDCQYQYQSYQKLLKLRLASYAPWNCQCDQMYHPNLITCIKQLKDNENIVSSDLISSTKNVRKETNQT